ncbi:hypothetical protein C8J95_10311 [Elizabethkingia sp. YR214]|uniref:hypothetical protein n=1 Tax=Elizabethkingia sp. YR214 TaxID=2135667 RepID=UPI000D322B7F|nr:hypothetical protein [Elizabethkingia sp. YR214]PUB33420.1 hypothetical protein C8J95_10311 [Elizabethkingia sp. YR214]
MNYKVSTYKFSIQNKNGENFPLGNLPGNIDFLNLFEEFCQDIITNTKKFNENGRDKSLTLREPQKTINDERFICGRFDAGTTGDPVNINNPETNVTNYSVTSDELQARILNFYIQIPRGNNEGFLILQRKSTHSIKKGFEDCFNSFLMRKGFEGENKIRIKLSPAPNFKLMERMMEYGDLKEINLVKNSVATNFQDYFDGIGSFGGVSIQQLKFDKKIAKAAYKPVLYDLYRGKYKENEQIEINGHMYDEITFTLYLDKTTKTFYVKDKSKIRSEIDITSMIGEDLYGEIPLNQFVEIAKKLITEIS